MRQVLSYFTLSIMVILVGCKTNNMSGVYVCDQPQKKTDSTIKHGDGVEVFMDITCIIQELDFKLCCRQRLHPNKRYRCRYSIKSKR
jgi:hypothetical protein